MPHDAPTPPAAPPAPHGARSSALRVTLGYLLLAALWLGGSYLVFVVLLPTDISPAAVLGLYGSSFVLLTSLMLYLLLQRDHRRRRAMLQQLERSEHDYRLVFDANPNPMYFFALDDLRFLEVNRAMVEQYGYTRDELLQMTLGDIRPREDVPGMLRDLDVARSHPREPWFGQYRHRRRDGSVFDVEIHSHVSRFGDRPARLVTALDISERIEVQRELANANRALGEASLRVIEAQERERHRIARELHDEIGQALSAIGLRMRLLLAGHGIPDQDPQAAPLMRMLSDTLEQTRSLSLQLRPPQLDDFGLPSAMRSLVKRLFADTGIHCELEIEGVRDGPSDRAAVTAYRIVQESLTNVLRHAEARHVRIELLGDAQSLRLKVIDDGCGFNPAGVDNERLGLSGIRERIELHGGRLALRTRPGIGTSLEAVLPWGGAA